jgi:hypothetical protein
MIYTFLPADIWNGSNRKWIVILVGTEMRTLQNWCLYRRENLVHRTVADDSYFSTGYMYFLRRSIAYEYAWRRIMVEVWAMPRMEHNCSRPQSRYPTRPSCIGAVEPWTDYLYSTTYQTWRHFSKWSLTENCQEAENSQNHNELFTLFPWIIILGPEYYL